MVTDKDKSITLFASWTIEYEIRIYTKKNEMIWTTKPPIDLNHACIRANLINFLKKKLDP